MDVFFSLGKDTVNEQFCKMPSRVLAQDLFLDVRPMTMNMKKILFVPLFACAMTNAQSQVQINPQVGLTFQSLTQAPDGYSYKANVGWQLGLDARIGDRLFLQPGAYLGRSVTAVSYSSNIQNGATGSVQVEDDLVRTSLNLRAQVGYRLIDTYQFDVRLMLGPSYDALMSVDYRDDDITWNKGDMRKGSWNLDAGVGLDMGLFTLSPTASFGLSRILGDNPTLSNIDSRYVSYGLTLGINLGNDDNE
jgi:hypothetical protein